MIPVDPRTLFVGALVTWLRTGRSGVGPADALTARIEALSPERDRARIRLKRPDGYEYLRTVDTSSLRRRP